MSIEIVSVFFKFHKCLPLQNMRRCIPIIVLLATSLTCACTLLHDDKVVAKVGRKKLFRSEVVKFIPAGTPAEDSLAMARQYVDAWAGELVLNDRAEKYLSKKEKDVSKELEDYKAALLKYRYEQHYITTHLDTVVTAEQIAARYEGFASQYVLDVPILKTRYVRVPATTPIRDELVKMLASDNEDDQCALDSLAYTVVDKYTDFNGSWVDIVTLAREFGTDYGSLLAARKDSYIDIVDEAGNEHIAYIVDFIPSGRKAPLEYCRHTIRDVIIEQRKYLLTLSLERDLLEQARDEGFYVTFLTDED